MDVSQPKKHNFPESFAWVLNIGLLLLTRQTIKLQFEIQSCLRGETTNIQSNRYIGNIRD